MNAPDKIWFESAWAETFARPDGDPAKVAYIPEAIAQASVAAALEAVIAMIRKGAPPKGSILTSDLIPAIRALITDPQRGALQAVIDAAKAEALAEDAAVLDASDEVKTYLDGVIGVVEANSFESMCLWMQAKESARSWISTGHGYGPMIGRINNRPVCLSILTANVDGNKIVFIDATSEVSDWKLIDAWLQKNLPQSAMHEDGRINKTDAMNFENVFPRAQIGAKT